MRRPLFALFGGVAAVLTTVLVVPSLVDWDRRVADAVHRITGRELAFEGGLSVALLPSPWLSADRVRLANVEGASAPEMARLGSLRVSARLAPLLLGRIEIADVALIEPVIALERLADGRANWALARTGTSERRPTTQPAPPARWQARHLLGGPALAASTPADTASPPRGPTLGGAHGVLSLARHIHIARLHVLNGALSYRNGLTGQAESVRNLHFRVDAASPVGPFDATGRLTLRGVSMAFRSSLGDVSLEGSIPIGFRLEPPEGFYSAQFSGALRAVTTVPGVTGQLNVTGVNLGNLLSRLAGHDRALGIPEWLDRPFSLDARIEASAAGLHVEDIALSLDVATLTGEAAWATDPEKRVALTLRIARGDAESLFGPESGWGSGDAGPNLLDLLILGVDCAPEGDFWRCSGTP